MRPIHNTYTVAAEETFSSALPVTRACSGYSYALAFSAGGATAELQYTLDDVYASGFSAATATWFGLGQRSADYSGVLDKPVTAFRLVYSGTVGVTVTLNLIAIPST